MDVCTDDDFKVVTKESDRRLHIHSVFQVTDYKFVIKTFNVLRQLYERINKGEVIQYFCTINPCIDIDFLLKSVNCKRFELKLPEWRDWTLFAGTDHPRDRLLYIKKNVISTYKLSSIDIYAILRRVLLQELDLKDISALFTDVRTIVEEH